MDDHHLLDRYKAGDEYAFTQFFNRHVKEVRRFARQRHQISSADLDVAVNEAFFATARRCKEERIDNPAGFVRQAVSKLCLKILSTQKAHWSLIDEVDQGAIENVEISVETVICEIDAIDRALRQLPPAEQEIICHLRDGKTLAHTSHAMNMPLTSTWRWRNEIVDRLKTLLA